MGRAEAKRVIRLSYRITKNLNLFEALIVVSILFAPFTKLRFSFFGVTEVCFIILFVLGMIYTGGILHSVKNPKFYILSKCFLILIVIMLFSWAVHILIGDPSGRTSSAVFNLFSYIMVLAALLSIDSIVAYDRNTLNWRTIMDLCFYSLSVAFIILYIISRSQSTLFGIRLLYYGKLFCPLADNIHQVSMILAPVAFFGVVMITEKRSILQKLIILALTAANLYIGSQIGSDKYDMGMVLGLIAAAIAIIYKVLELPKTEKRILILLIVTLVAVLVLLNYGKVADALVDAFAERDGHGARSSLYSLALEKSTKSILIGFGPASHIEVSAGSYYDAHQTLLAVLLQSGLLGLGVFLFFLYRVFRQLLKTPVSLAGTIPILIYLLGGDLLRRLPVWIILMIYYYHSLFRTDQMPQEITIPHTVYT